MGVDGAEDTCNYAPFKWVLDRSLLKKCSKSTLVKQCNDQHVEGAMHPLFNVYLK